MASLAQWNPIALQQIAVNPNSGLNVASNAFRNVSDIAAQHENNRVSDAFKLGTLLLEKQKQDIDTKLKLKELNKDKDKLALENEKGKLFSEIEKSAGYSLADQFFQNEITQTPEYQALLKQPVEFDGSGMLTPEQAAQNRLQVFNDEFKANNKRLLSDPTNYYNQVKTKLLDSGKFSLEEADAYASQATNRLFPTMDKDIALKLMQDYKGDTGSASGSGGKGSSKLLSGLPDSMDEATLHQQFLERHGITNKAPVTIGGFRPFDMESYDPTGTLQRDTTQYDITKIVNTLKQGPDGVMPVYAYNALDSMMDADGQLPFRAEDLVNKDGSDSKYLKALKTKARSFQDAQERTAGDNGNGILSTTNRMIQEHNNAILSKLNPNQSTREKRIQTYLSAFPQAAKKLSEKGLLSNTINVDTPKVKSKPVVVTPQKETTAVAPSKIFPEQKQPYEINFNTPTHTKEGNYIGKGIDQLKDLLPSITNWKANKAASPIIEAINAGKEPSAEDIKMWKRRMGQLGLSENDYPEEFLDKIK